MLLGAYRLALDAARAAAESAISRLILSLYSPRDRDASIQTLTPALTEIVRSYRGETYGHAVEMIQTQAEQQGFDAPYIPAQSGYSEQSVQTILKDDLRGSPDEAVSIIAPKLGQHVEDSARQTTIRTVEDGREPSSEAEREHWSRDALTPDEIEDGIDRLRRKYITEGRALNWARVLSGAENCGFCVMLASRGPVYQSEEAAGVRRASDLYDTKVEGWLNSYHPNCDCVVVPIYSFSDWPGREDWQKLEKFYRSALEDREWTGRHPKNPDLAAVEQALRRLRENGESLPITDLRAGTDDAQQAA